MNAYDCGLISFWFRLSNDRSIQDEGLRVLTLTVTDSKRFKRSYETFLRGKGLNSEDAQSEAAQLADEICRRRQQAVGI